MPCRTALPCLLLALLSTAASAECDEPKGQYRGKLFDAMAQIEGGMAGRVEEAINKAGVQRIALFGREKLGSSTSGGERDVMALAARLPERVIPGAPKFFADSSAYESDILRKLGQYLTPERKRAFVGELLIVHGDKSHGSSTAAGERTMDTTAPAFTELLRNANALQMPFMLHWEVYDWSRDWPRMSALYAQWPQLVFIWPHAGFGSAAQVREVIEKHPNVMMTLSKTEQGQDALSAEKSEQIGPPLIDACGRIDAEWNRLLLDHPERFLFATDAHKDFRWNRYERIVHRWRNILKQLPGPIARQIAHGNAMRVYHLKPDASEAPEAAASGAEGER